MLVEGIKYPIGGNSDVTAKDLTANETISLKIQPLITEDKKVEEDEVMFCYGLEIDDDVTLDVEGILINLA